MLAKLCIPTCDSQVLTRGRSITPALGKMKHIVIIFHDCQLLATAIARVISSI